ncbi:MAG: hypothetical protein WCE44_08810 [Candidatus Velthaea sp.]
MDTLPAEAEAAVKRIEALLGQAEPLLGDGADEAAYALRETERRYLPDTVQAYLDIPPARRDATAQSMLVDQLALLERATAQRLAALAERSETALAANGSFLTERFGAIESLPEAPAVDPTTAPPAMLVRRVLDRVVSAGTEPTALLEVAATRLAAAFPSIVTVQRAGFFGKGPVASLALDIPRPDDVLRYLLVGDRFGVRAMVERYVRGIRLKVLTVDVSDWTAGLLEDLTTYVERERAARDVLTRLFAKEFR